MHARRLIALAAMAAMVLPLGSARAEEVTCSTTISGASAAAPHVIDETNDYNGVTDVAGKDAVPPSGAIYREGTDITKGWISRNEAGGLVANIEVVNLAEAQPNAIFYFLWDFEGEFVNPNNGATQDATQRWVSARFRTPVPTPDGAPVGTGTYFSWGYMGPGTTPTSNATFVTTGTTTGSYTSGPAGVISIDIPAGETPGGNADGWGNPPVGTILGNPRVESRILLGSPEAAPPNPVGIRHGFVYEVDVTTNAVEQCEPVVD